VRPLNDYRLDKRLHFFSNRLRRLKRRLELMLRS
jgi:hypothetical protein